MSLDTLYLYTKATVKTTLLFRMIINNKIIRTFIAWGYSNV